MDVLLGLSYSPWSEKARWALDVRRVPYRLRRYEPLLGEPELRARLRKPTGRVSVPVLLVDGGRALADSLAIARWADARGEGPTLFPPEHDAAIERWVRTSEDALSAGRALSLRRMLEDDDALLEMVPRPLRALRRPAILTARLGVERTLRKYGGRTKGAPAHEQLLAAVLDELRAALAARGHAKGAPTTLLPAFTFADVAMAQALAFVSPPAFGLRLGHASRRTFTDAQLAVRYADLLDWRDALYEAHRPR
jgi:glutathione S-transferase